MKFIKPSYKKKIRNFHLYGITQCSLTKFGGRGGTWLCENCGKQRISWVAVGQCNTQKSVEAFYHDVQTVKPTAQRR